ncbi:MAG: phosphate ABC transporter permease PstA [Geminicoccaceae bacterium]|nr:phosphate ABC transporter permease PstA [Geminicoccaceae bacterium]
MTEALRETDLRPLERLVSGPRPTFAEGNELVRRRYARERRFRLMGLGAIGLALGLLAVLLLSVGTQGYKAFWQTYVTLDIDFARDRIDPEGTGDPAVIGKANFQELINGALYRMFPDVEGRRDRKALRGLVSSAAALDLREQVKADPSLIGQTVPVEMLASDDIDQLMKGEIDRNLKESNRRVKDRELIWVDALAEQGRIETRFNTVLFTHGDSREPEQAGIWGAVVGSFYMMIVTLLLAAPIGIAAATYLEEFAPKSRMTDFIEVNINNLAAVPSIVFGLLGLAVFLQVFHLPRSAPLVGGLTLTLMTLPTIVVATRASLRSVPPSIREAALGMGASKVQTVAHHVLPLALPGILTGAIIGMAQALGETAPLLMIGMVAFIVDIPATPLDPATALPVQIYLWADSPERAFTERTAAAIMVLLAFLVIMNALAVILRRKFERKW